MRERKRETFFLKFNSYRFDFLYKQKVLVLPVSEVALVPSMPREGIAFPPHVGFDRASKLVRHTTAGSPHGTEGASNTRVAGNQCVIVHLSSQHEQ